MHRRGIVATGLALGIVSAMALAGPDSTVVSGDLAGSSLVADRTGDCQVTDIDIAVTALLQLDLSAIGDLDGDGDITANDKIEAIKRLILKSYGDVNGDGAVDLDDVAQAMQDAGVGAAVESDANMDGKTDGEDVLYVVDALGGETPWLVEDIAGELYSVMSQIEAEGGANAFLNTEACVGGNPEHRAAISDTWYVPGSDHQRSLSRLWPNNHFVSISVSWDDVDHSVATSHSDKWPADHEGVYSCTWSHAPDSGTDATCPDSEHSFAVSQAHPGEHEVARSDLWHNAPGHYYSRSQTWPTDIGEHEPAISRTWPGNHFYDISDGGGVSNHHEEYSYYDWPGDHDTHRSQNWPPSHEESVSISWAPGHSDPWSFRWPPNHTSFVSATWDPGSYPTQWPPNHVASFSEQQNQPGPWDETWPPDHSRWDSVREILDLTPPLLPDQWWPLP
ncbi:MAG: hypothetical protein H6810_03005 [Phycisphaeraceae bacterium]|nr:MAG: hypothetical protein H6810_03005 [Phycisphaeraceae bacterium]